MVKLILDYVCVHVKYTYYMYCVTHKIVCVHVFITFSIHFHTLAGSHKNILCKIYIFTAYCTNSLYMTTCIHVTLCHGFPQENVSHGTPKTFDVMTRGVKIKCRRFTGWKVNYEVHVKSVILWLHVTVNIYDKMVFTKIYPLTVFCNIAVRTLVAKMNSMGAPKVSNVRNSNLAVKKGLHVPLIVI